MEDKIEYFIKIDDKAIVLTEQPEIYLFTDKSCTTSKWMPFDMNKISECQTWISKKINEDSYFNLHHFNDIRFKLKNHEDVKIFSDWISLFMNNTSKNVPKKDIVKDIEYFQYNNYLLKYEVTFLNSTITGLNNESVSISADFILNNSYEKR